MKVIAFCVLCLVSSSLAFAVKDADFRASDECNADVCSGSCVCSSLTSPIDVSSTPQLVTLVYPDSVTEAIVSGYLKPLIEGRTNPDGVQIGATLYVPHEFTDYEMVNSLYNLGLEIGVHSISRNNLDSYWQEAPYDTLLQEFDGQRQILAHFANIPIEDVVGGKMPNLYMRGNDMIEAFQAAGLEYDNTWITRSNNRYFPYTLDYLSSVSCGIGECPTKSYPGFWELPIVNMVGVGNSECNSLQGCGITGTSSVVKDWLMEQFQRVYSNNRAPMTLVVGSGWLSTSTSNLEGLTLFLDELKSLSDVFLVSHRQVVDWMKNPVEASAFKTDEHYREQSCVARSCALNKDGEERYMKSCVACPSSYPWLGKPLGQ